VSVDVAVERGIVPATWVQEKGKVTPLEREEPGLFPPKFLSLLFKKRDDIHRSQ